MHTIPNYDAISAFLEEKHRSLHLPGVAVAIVQDGKPVYLRGLGTAGNGRAMTAQTPLYIGSISKGFTALAIMQLVDAGKLALDDPIQKHIPWFQLADQEFSSCITIRQVLTHTSGISRYAGRELLAGCGGKTLEQSVRELRELHPSHPVGTFEYSNYNYVIAGLVVEMVARCPFGDYIKEHILIPLGMENTFVSEAAALQAGLSCGYRWWFGVPVQFSAPFVDEAVPAAFMVSSAEDLGRYAMALLNAQIPFKKGIDPILSLDGITALFSPGVKTSPHSTYALGWRMEVQDTTVFLRHGGQVSNFLSEIVLIPQERMGVVVLMNAASGLIPLAVPQVSRLASDLTRFLLGMPLPHRRVSFRGFYILLDLALGALSLYQILSFIQIVRGRTTRLHRFLGIVSLCELLLGIVTWRRLPRVADAPWRLLRLYVPDILTWLVAFCVLSLLKCLAFFSKRRST